MDEDRDGRQGRWSDTTIDTEHDKGEKERQRVQRGRTKQRTTDAPAEGRWWIGVEKGGTETGIESYRRMRIYLSALSVHRAEQRANIVFTHTHGFAMQIIWYYCTYSAYRRGSSVTGTASTLLSFLLPWPSIYLHDTRTYIRRIETYPVIAAFSSNRHYLQRTFFGPSIELVPYRPLHFYADSRVLLSLFSFSILFLFFLLEDVGCLINLDDWNEIF